MRLPTGPSALFEFLIVDADEAAAHPGTLQAMFHKRLDGVILRGALTPDVVARAVAAIEGGALPRRVMAYTEGHQSPAYTIGTALINTPLGPYLDDAPEQTRRLAHIFGEEGWFEERVRGLVSALAGGLPAEAAPGPDGRACPFASLRVLPEGTEIGVHVGNEFTRIPKAEHLRAAVDLTDQLSWFCPLVVPERGGELVVYGVEWSDVADRVPVQEGATMWLPGSAVYEAMTRMASTAFSPGPGDLLIFDGGRYFHRVSRVEGPRARCTIGGFLGFSQAHDRVYVWT